MRRLRTDDPEFRSILTNLNRSIESGEAVTQRVQKILHDVRTEGDDAVLRYTRQFDQADLSVGKLRVPPSELEEAVANLTATTKRALKEALRHVRAFHRAGLPHGWKGKNPHGAQVGENYYPLERVGIYVPGGNVPLISTVVMSCGLAQLANVPEVAVCTPPQSDGSIHPDLLAALSLCGVTEVYRIGGVQAIGALAFGTETIAPVDKIFGPGREYTNEAKRQVLGTVGIDLLAGPSEVMVIADHTANANWIAADLLAQAEHGSGKERVVLVTTDESLAIAVEAAILRQLPQRKHDKAIRKVLDVGGLIVLARDLEDAARAANLFAPEHLELQVEPARFRAMLKQIRTAGAILLGHQSPTVLGDYIAGPSHTLPTGGAGRAFSGLRITDFFRRTSVVRYNQESLQAARDAVATFARLEDLEAHGQSLEVRFNGK